MKWNILLTAIIATLEISSSFAAEPLKSALDGKAPPYAMPTMDGSIEGLTVDMTHAIAKQLGQEITIDAMSFSTLIPALQAGTYDMLSVPFTATEERANAFLLTEGIWSADLVFLISNKEEQVSDYAQLKGKVIATNKGNAYDKWARENSDKYGWRVESYGSLNDAAQAVQVGRAYAALIDTATGLTIQKRNPVLKVTELVVKTGKYYSYPVPKTNPELRIALDKAIECIKSDGTAAELYKKWLGVEPREGSLEVSPQPGYGPVGLPNYDAAEHSLECK